MKTLIAPKITEGDWRVSRHASGLLKVETKDRVVFDGFKGEEANAVAAAALPAVLKALEKMWGSHRIEDLDPEISTHQDLIAVHAALKLAGYTESPQTYRGYQIRPKERPAKLPVEAAP